MDFILKNLIIFILRIISEGNKLQAPRTPLFFFGSKGARYAGEYSLYFLADFYLKLKILTVVYY